MEPVTPAWFEREHRRLGAMFHAYLLDLAGADFAGAQQHFQRWQRALARHIRTEDARLLPHVPEGARWSARVYRLEHARIASLADDSAVRLAAVVSHPPRDDTGRREAVLALLDGSHALRHLLEHHHQREEMALAHELPPELLVAALPANAVD